VNGLQRRKLIFYSRHGIRIPYSPDPRGVDIFSTKDAGINWFTNYSDWGAGGEAELTEHGKRVVSRMGEYFKQELVDTGFISSDGSDVTIYSDYDSTQRDIKTARSFFRGMLPGVNVTILSNASEIAALFNQGGTPGGIHTSCVGPTQLQVEGTIGGDANKLSAISADAINRLSDVIKCCQPSVCNRTVGPCSLIDMPTTWVGNFWQFYDGPFFAGASLTEYLELVYLNNMSLAETAPGLDEFGLSRLVELHQENLDVTEDYVATQSYGSDMLAHLLGTMEQLLMDRHVEGFIKSRPSDKLVYYAGHDINIYFLRNFLRLNWLTDSWNGNEAVPGGMVVFELLEDKAYRSSGDAFSPFFIKVFYVSQSLAQMREARDLTKPALGPDSVFVTIPECASGPEASCPLRQFRDLVLRSIRSECVSSVAVGDL